MTTLRETMLEAAARLSALPHAAPRLEAELLLADTLGVPRTHLRAWPERRLTEAQGADFERRVARRLAGEPIAYIRGHQEFWSLDLAVTPDVLIPRPETELLVELALQAFPAQRETATDFRAVDLGTGSGAVAAALARERPHWQLYAGDLSAAALAVAEANFRRIGLRVRTLAGSWYQALPPDLRFDLIVSNPPYVAAGDPHLRRGDPPREPRLALEAGGDGLDALRLLAAGAPRHLLPGGRILLEHGYDQGAAVRDLLRRAGLAGVRTWRDLAGQERITGGSQPAQIP